MRLREFVSILPGESPRCYPSQHALLLCFEIIEIAA